MESIMSLLATTLLVFLSVAQGHVLQSDMDHQHLIRKVRADMVSMCDNGTRQSPINIDHCCRKTLEADLAWSGYNNMTNVFELTNTGSRAEIRNKAGVSSHCKIFDGPLDSVYALQDIHFHWAKTNEKGSDHSFQGKYGAMEAHFTHYNLKYASYDEARTKEDGIASIGIIFELSPNKNNDLEPLMRKLEQIVASKSSVDLPMSDLPWVPDYFSRTYYASYQGSLASPPCAEVVTWMVMRKMSFISAEQVDKFRQLLNTKGEKIVEFKRDQKPTFNRQIICPRGC